MVKPIDGLVYKEDGVYSFSSDEIDRIDYYLTIPNIQGGKTRLGAKLKLKNGEQYTNIIEIPFDELKKLVESVEKPLDSGESNGNC